jgi:hypothetical protein
VLASNSNTPKPTCPAALAAAWPLGEPDPAKFAAFARTRQKNKNFGLIWFNLV